jgi:hypothetical protein
METSEQINELATALSKAQATIIGAVKDSANPFFKSSYADLASVLDAARKPLTDNGLCLIQGVSTGDGAVHVTSLLAHSSGQWVKSTISLVPADWKPQTVGGCATYGRRYGGAAIIGVAQIDDDGNAASGRHEAPKKAWGVHSPLGDLDPEVADTATKYADTLKEALSSGTPERIAEINADMANERDPSDQPWGEVLKRAVWAQLDSKARSSIKKILNGATQ